MTRPASPCEAGVDGVVDPVERERRAERARQLEPTRLDVLEHRGERDGRVLRPVERAGEPLLLPDQLERVEVEPQPLRRQADDHGRAAVAGRAERRLDRLGVSDGVEGEVRPVGQLRPEQLAQVVGHRDVRRARDARRVEPCGNGVAGDDRPRARDPCALHHELADAARPDHEHRRAGRHVRRVEDGADPRQDGAAEQGGLVERHGGPERKCDLLRDDDPLGEAAGGRAAVHGRAAVRHPRRAVGQRAVGDRRVERLARRRPPAAAAGAHAARRRPREHDLVAHPERRDRIADLLHDTRALVAEHHGRRAAELPLHLVEVGPADPDRRHADDDLVRTRVVEVQLDDLQGLADRTEERGAGLQSHLHRAQACGRERGRFRISRRDPQRIRTIRLRIRRLQVKRAPPSRPRSS